MAFDAKPSTWLANWSEDGTNITVPIATFPELTDAEADATTGDIRKVLFAVCDGIWDSWVATDSANRPTKMTIYKSVSTNTETGVATVTYQFQFSTEVLTTEVAAES